PGHTEQLGVLPGTVGAPAGDFVEASRTRIVLENPQDCAGVTEVAQSLLARFHQLSADAGSPVAGIDVDRIALAVSDGDEANPLARDLRDDGRKPTPVLGPLGERDRRELLFAEQV